MLRISGAAPIVSCMVLSVTLAMIHDTQTVPPKVPLGLMDFVIGILDFFAGFNPQGLEDAAEFGRIGKYYASESMLVYDPVAEKYLPGSETPSYGEDTLEAFFRRAVKEGGLEGQELGDAAIFSE